MAESFLERTDITKILQEVRDEGFQAGKLELPNGLDSFYVSHYPPEGRDFDVNTTKGLCLVFSITRSDSAASWPLQLLGEIDSISRSAKHLYSSASVYYQYYIRNGKLHVNCGGSTTPGIYDEWWILAY